MLDTLIRNSLTNNQLCTYMINKNKYYLICSLMIDSIPQLDNPQLDNPQLDIVDMVNISLHYNM
jgi:hypothetical protein